MLLNEAIKVNLKREQLIQNIVQVQVTPLSENYIPTLAKQWIALEAQAHPQYFLSWKWISAWLTQIKNTYPVNIIIANKKGNVVGIGIFIEKSHKRYRILPCKQWLLHRTGNEQQDQIWIENNTFLIHSDFYNEVHKTMWHWLFNNKKSIDEFIVSVYKEQLLLDCSDNYSHYNEVKEKIELGYQVDLKTLKTIDDYYVTLSKNTRQQIKRSLKLLALRGEIQFKVSTNPVKQLQLLENSKHWHIEKWQKSSTPSGFNNPLFNQFHKNMIETKHPTAQTLVASLTINNDLYGCLYCLTQNKTAYFYLSNLKPIQDNKIKLGLTMHTLMVEWLILNDFHTYDFLAGEARYKKSLANHQDKYYSLTLQKKSWKFKVGQWLKQLKVYLVKANFLLKKGQEN